MNVRQYKQWLNVSTGIVVVVALVVLGWGLAAPVRIVAEEAKGEVIAVKMSNVPPALDHANGAQPKVQLQTLLALCQQDWRKPLFDGQMTEDHADQGQPAEQVFMNLRLLGTAIEVGHSMALFQKSDGSVGVCEEGGEIEDSGSRITVRQIVGTTVVVQCGGQTQKLAMPLTMEATP